MKVYKCDYCKKTARLIDTLVIVDSKDTNKEKRLCRDCQLKFYIDEAKNRGMKVGIYGKFSDGEIRDAEGHQVKWSKDIKDGK